VQDTEEADFRSQVPGIARNFEKSFGTGAEQQTVDDLFILQGQRSQPVWKREDYMDVARREKLSSACCDPPLPGRGLTLRAVAIATAVIGDGGAMPAAGALIEMTAKRGSTTPPNGPQHFDMLPVEPVPIAFQESSSRAADEIGHLEGRPVHLLLLR
jgi:hypothetical protein